MAISMRHGMALKLRIGVKNGAYCVCSDPFATANTFFHDGYEITFQKCSAARQSVSETTVISW